MKKFGVLLLVLSVCLITGCTKNYKTVDEYDAAMKTVRAKNSSYTIEAKQKVGTIELYYKSYIKGDRWKTEMSMNGGSSYMQTVLYDGNELLSYAQGSPYAMVNPAMEMLKNEDEESRKFAINAQNPVYQLVDWKEGGLFGSLSSGKPEFVNNKDKKNGYECRLIKFNEDREACVSDKYGIAVYQKLTAEDYKNPGTKQDLEINLVKVDNTDIPDSTFELPEGVTKMDMQSMLMNISKMFKN